MNVAFLYEQMFTIRCVETRLLELFGEGKLNGTTHAYIGQEANGVGVLSHLTPADTVWSNHRCHGHYIAYTNDVEGLVHELVGTEKGVCAGKGGSQHLCNGNFYTNGIQGSIVPLAAGMALAEKLRKTGAIAVVFVGDGTLGEGSVYEALNIAALWSLPLLFVVEDNMYAQSTPSSLQIAGLISSRPKTFTLETFEVSSNDIQDTFNAAKEAVSYVRENQKPAALVMHTYRLCPHSKGDDTRDPQEIASWREKDPIKFAARHLDDTTRLQIEEKVRLRVEKAVSDALVSASPGETHG